VWVVRWTRSLPVENGTIFTAGGRMRSFSSFILSCMPSKRRVRRFAPFRKSTMPSTTSSLSDDAAILTVNRFPFLPSRIFGLHHTGDVLDPQQPFRSGLITVLRCRRTF